MLSSCGQEIEKLTREIEKAADGNLVALKPLGLGFRVQGSGFRVQGSGFRV